MTATKLTAAEEYAQLKARAFSAFLEESFSDASLKGVPLYEVKCPSGLVIKCRKADGMISAQLGQMPMTLSAQVLGETKTEHTDEQTAVKQMTPMERAAAIAITAKIVQYIAVEPRLVIGDVGDRTDAISVDMLTFEDFNHLATWAQGGAAAEGLKTFRRKRR